MLRRTCAKTPVFCVGQLESKGDAQSLAQYYQGLLPPRLMTPFLDLDSDAQSEYATIIPVRTIRKIKRQQSLRSLMKKHSRCESISDSETLVGWESPKEPLSPWLPHDDVKKLDDNDDKFLNYTLQNGSGEFKAFDNDMALKKCMELLSNELSAVIAEQQPSSDVRKSSGLQILLMIESYEKVQQHLRRNIEDHEKGQIKDVERILEYWLKVLYSVYDRSYEFSMKEHEDYFPPPLSVVTNQKPPRRSIQRKPVPITTDHALSRNKPRVSQISC